MTDIAAKEIIRRDADSVVARILDAAQVEFMRAGYDRASTNRIASEFSISKATIFRHFPSKQALFEAVIARVATRWHERIDWQAIGDLGPEAWLNRFATAALTWILEDEALFVGRMAIVEGPAHAEARALWPRLATRPILNVLIERFEAWNLTGTLQTGDSERLAWAFLDLTLAGEVSRALYGSSIHDGPAQIEAHVAFCVRLFLSGASGKREG
ncbi:TetR/AcrR family transcriptional regulator [Sphingomonas sp.]|uniref:TetR/AcrR family transcriptional regulator n=1 Tax=Sphingomonas sp. TaxID=28214 RepID=UPI003BA8C66A